MTDAPVQITLGQWESRYQHLRRAGFTWPDYCVPFSRHVCQGDTRLTSLLFDNAPAAFRLWNFLLTEEDRLRQAKDRGCYLVGAMKDLGTVPVMAYSLDNVVAFYPDGAWWIPCIMEMSAGLLEIADKMGVDESFCPVRAMLGAFVTEAHFPIPDLLVCSAGAVCDDFSAISQRLNGLGYPILWWEIPHRRKPDAYENPVELPGGYMAPEAQVAIVKAGLEQVRSALENLSGQKLDAGRLRAGIQKANHMRAMLTRFTIDLRSIWPDAWVHRIERMADCPITWSEYEPAIAAEFGELYAGHFQVPWMNET